ncbi:MAG: YfhO family protein, partial [Candidatus Lustribacter sp.]
SPDAGGMQVAPKRGVLDDLVKQAEGQVPAADLAAVHRASAEVGGIDESAFFEHPPRDITFHTVVTRAEPRLLADLALDPSSYEPAPLCGGPVTFTLRAFRDGTAVGSASRTIDPKHVLADRHWMPLSIDLSRSVGRALDIHFQTSAADTCAAWALWGEPRFVPSGERDAYRQNQFVFPLAYRAPGVDIFRVPDSLSRFTIYHRAQSVASFKDAVSALTSPAFNVHNQVVVEGPVPPLAAATGRDSITVTFMRSDEVTASVIVGSAGLLMQNDSFYPGWKATIDGREVPILKADGFFRGIPVDAGRHTVVITYQSGTALAGTLLSLAGTIVFAVLLIDPIPLLRRRTAAA